jgi:hypothetical protein
MKNYKILVANKTYQTSNLQYALDLARRESLIGYRVSVLDGNTKIATDQGGDLKEWKL